MTDDTIAPAATPAPLPTARIAPGAKARAKTVALEWPVEFDGAIYDSVTISRLTSAQVVAFFEAAKAGDAWLPMFDCPRAVIDALDADDAATVNDVVSDFLPRALRTVAD